MEGEEQGPGLGETSVLDRGFSLLLVGKPLVPAARRVSPLTPQGHWGDSPFSQTCLGDTLPCPCRSFENNWNIYKLLAHQKPAQEKVRGDGEQQGTPSLPWGHTGMCCSHPCPCRAPSAWPS